MSDVIILTNIEEQNPFPSQYYNISDEHHFWCRWRFRVFQNQLLQMGILPSDQIRVLDLGCGNGVVRRQIEKSTNWMIDGADIDYEALKTNRVTRGETYLYNLFDRNPELAGRYDHIILFDVLEHIEDTTAFLEAVKFHLKPGGMIMINVPAMNFLWSVYDAMVKHVMRYTVKPMRKQLETAGLTIRRKTYWGGSLILILLMRKLMLLFLKDEKEIIDKGFNPPSGFINRLMIALMWCETSLFRKLPLGTSLLVFASENQAPDSTKP